MPTEMELTLEQTQQGVSYEVSNIRVNSFTMKMEILLEPTSNKLMVEHAEYDESNTYVLERFNTTAGNPVKKILLKLNLSDHRLFKDGGGVKEFQRSFRHSDTERLSRSDEVLKLKNFKKDATLKLFKSTNQVRYEHVGPTITSSQDGKVNKMAKRDYAWLMISSWNGAWIFESKRSEGGRGVKEKSLNRNLMNTSPGIGVSTESDDTMNEDTPVDVASAVKEGVTPSVVDMTGEMEKQNALDDNTVLESFPPLSKPVTTEAGNAPGKSSYANVTGKPSGKKLNIRTLFTPGGNGIDVVVPVESIRAISDRPDNSAYGL
ncbi:hypothetical protein Tco_1482529 [Tanacetum coccineum]